jgi:hypothetical protein
MGARTRTREMGLRSGSYTLRDFFGNVTTTQRNELKASFTQVTNDVTGNFPFDNVFESTTYTKECSLLTGTYNNAGTRIDTSGGFIPSGFQITEPQTSVSNIGPGTSDAAYATMTAARSNPSRPVVDLPVAIAELRDLPRMIKQAGDAIHWLRSSGTRARPTARGLADANLAYSFGWEPLLSDLYKLLTFQSAYEKKRKHLVELYSGRGLRRSVSLGSELLVTNGSNMTFESIAGLPFTTRWTRKQTYRAWGTIRWKPTVVPPGTRDPTDLEVYRAALGLDITLATVWEALPWTWLIDWFSTAGDFLAAHRNTIPATHSNICIMRMYQNECRYTPQQVPNGLTWGGASPVWSRKTRVPYSSLVYPTAYLPFLGGRQLSILGSLAITRGLFKP